MENYTKMPFDPRCSQKASVMPNLPNYLFRPDQSAEWRQEEEVGRKKNKARVGPTSDDIILAQQPPPCGYRVAITKRRATMTPDQL